MGERKAAVCLPRRSPVSSMAKGLVDSDNNKSCAATKLQTLLSDCTTTRQQLSDSFTEPQLLFSISITNHSADKKRPAAEKVPTRLSCRPVHSMHSRRDKQRNYLHIRNAQDGDADENKHHIRVTWSICRHYLQGPWHSRINELNRWGKQPTANNKQNNDLEAKKDRI